MKFIVIGLGYFGSTLASTLTSMGHEVLGIDNRQEQVDDHKDTITYVMQMDTTNVKAVESLPLEDADAVIVAIGEDVGSSVLTVSILKNLGIKRIIGRVISPVHQNILKQIGITETIHPEKETAMLVSSTLRIKNAIRIIDLNEDNVLSEIPVPRKYVGHTIDSMNVENRFGIKLIGVKKATKTHSPAAFSKSDHSLDLRCDPQTILGENDILLLAGNIDRISRFTEG